MGISNIDLLKNKTSWFAHYWWQGREFRIPFDTSAEAFRFLEEEEETDTLTTWGIIRPDGVEVLCPFRGGDEAEWEALKGS